MLLRPLQFAFLYRCVLTAPLRNVVAGLSHDSPPASELAVLRRLSNRRFTDPVFHLAYAWNHRGLCTICRAFFVNEDELAAVQPEAFDGRKRRPIA